MKYLGKDAAIAIEEKPSDRESNNDQLNEPETGSISTIGEEMMLMPALAEDEEDDLEFFDTVQSQSALPAFFQASGPLAFSPTSSHTTILRLIDELCPCMIDMFAKRGKYTSVYSFRGKHPEHRPLFRTLPISVEFLGDHQMAEIDDLFPHRMASMERTRRVLGLRYAKELSGKKSPSRLSEFQKLITPFDRKFLRRDPPILKNIVAVKSGFIARALSDRHWVEEWGIITEEDIVFYHIDKTKPNFRISRSNIVRVESIAGGEESIIPMYYFLSIETFGRSTYLMFRLEDDRNSWVDTIMQHLSVDAERNGRTTFTNHLINVDEPAAEFLHKSTMWDCNKRKILNCRNLSFKTPSAERQPDSLALAETALIKATSLQPKGPNDSDLIEFLNSAAALKDADAHSLNLDERLAFFLNVYHVMIMHAFIVLGPPDSAFNWLSYFNILAYQCSDDIFSLAELEHNIIRAEMCFPSQFLSRFILPKSQFRFALAKPDFRINFALNSGSLSIPGGAVPLYKSEFVHEQLDTVTRKFVNYTISFSQKGLRDTSILLPRVCLWFAEDFGDGSANDVMKVLGSYLNEEKRNTLRGLWSERKKCHDIGIWNVKYLPYNFECRFLTLETETSVTTKPTFWKNRDGVG